MSDHDVQRHYAGGDAGTDIAARILASLRAAMGADAAITPETLAPLDHFNSRGLAGTKEMVALLEPRAGDAVLDIGCGIGGAARWISMKYRCVVVGVDLTAAFCEAARELNAACGLVDRVQILTGSALALPLSNARFDRAYSHGVLMNIADKATAYREAFRVLKAGGRLVLFQHNAGPNGPPEFPLPWAAVADNSFLATDAETCRDLAAAGFEIVLFRDMTQDNLSAHAEMRRRTVTEGPPPPGMHVLIGEALELQRANSRRALQDGRARTVAIVAAKPS